MKRISSFLILTVLLILSLSVTASASSDDAKRTVYDRAGVFTQSEISDIEAAAEKYYAKSYASFYVVTDTSAIPSYSDGDDFLREYGISGDCIVLIITDNYAKNYNIYPYGRCYSKISDEEYNRILDDSGVYGNIKSGRYASGAVRCMELSEIACRSNVGGYVAGALITVTIITGIFVGITVYSYRRKLRSEKYPLDRFASLDLNLKRDDFITKFVAVTVIRSESSSGGRGGSRGGGRSGR